jgi:hypothetical protein
MQMLSAVPRSTASPRSQFVLSMLAIAVLLITGARTAAAQTGYAQVWTPENARESASLRLHGGVFSPIEVNAPSPTIGLRLSKFVGSHLQAGVLTGWTFERKDRTQNTSTLPGTAPQLLLARLDGHLVPAMGFLQVNITQKSWLHPYFGVGVGYEWLTIEGTNYETQETGTMTFDNIAWEGWAGMGFRLGKDLRIDGELFYHGASLERDVTDDTGETWKEIVNLNGVGARFGIDIIFR